MLALALFAFLGSVLEAAECVSACAGEGPAGECGQDLCCSCCVHFRIDRPLGCPTCATADPGRSLAPGDADLGAAPDPRDILHVPKPLAP
jgi:hypothetical protein